MTVTRQLLSGCYLFAVNKTTTTNTTRAPGVYAYYFKEVATAAPLQTQAADAAGASFKQTGNPC
jgi:hypothetical protein